MSSAHNTRPDRMAWWARRKSTRWEKLDVFVYGRAVTLRVRVIDVWWYVAAGSELVRLVLVRDFPGHDGYFRDATLDTRTHFITMRCAKSAAN